jgi:hypothetical protein
MSDDLLFPGREAAGELADAAWRPFEDRRERAERVAAVHWSGAADRNPAELDFAEADLERQYRPMAAEAAEVAHTRDFPTRWGVRELEWVGDASLLVVYNNNPYPEHATARDRELQALRRYMAEDMIDTYECGYAEYPATGKSEGYSYAMLVLTDPGFAYQVVEKYFALIATALPAYNPHPGPDAGG